MLLALVPAAPRPAGLEESRARLLLSAGRYATNRQAACACERKRAWRTRCQAAEAVLQAARADMAAIEADHVRQRQAAQELLAERVVGLEAQLAAAAAALQEAHDAAAAREAALQALQRDRREAAAAAGCAADALRAQFAAMLQDALADARAALEASSAG